MLTKKGEILELAEGRYENHVGRVETEGEFNRWMEAEMEHQRELLVLSRRPVAAPDVCEWGKVTKALTNGPGIIRVLTESGGGLILDQEQNNIVRCMWRLKSGQYEMECDWAIVAKTFPQSFTKKERQLSEAILKDYMPHQYMCITGITISESESSTLREESIIALQK